VFSITLYNNLQGNYGLPPSY